MSEPPNESRSVFLLGAAGLGALNPEFGDTLFWVEFGIETKSFLLLLNCPVNPFV